ncbi:MAG: DnaJ domain-containing protein [Deltaproteobacteria bacterium]|nr:DnaJ domain-containing protein [Deltaproteobacteria bacterium]
MSTVPAEIAGLGSSAMKLRISPGFDPLKAQVGPEEYFVLSRVDGMLTIREVLLQTGLPIDRGIQILTKLRSIGALLLPGETTAPAPGSLPPRSARGDATATPARPMTPPRGVGIPPRASTAPIAPPLSSRPATPFQPGMPREQHGVNVDSPTSRLPPNLKDVSLDGPTIKRTPEQRDAEVSVVLPRPTEAEQAALAEAIDLSHSEKVRILAMARLVDGADPWALLGVERGVNDKTLKRAYFKLSKDIHPDRFYGKQLGTFGDRLAAVFEAVSRAYAKLTTPEKKPTGRTGVQQAIGSEQPQTPQEYASELFDRACGLEVSGDALGAMKLFAAAVRIDPQTRYLRRAASCALAAGQPKTAVEYAKKAQTQAPDDPSSARLLAAAFRAAGKLADAEEVLVMAMALKSENDTLTAELRNDLAEVRRQLANAER